MPAPVHFLPLCGYWGSSSGLVARFFILLSQVTGPKRNHLTMVLKDKWNLKEKRGYAFSLGDVEQLQYS